MPLWRVLLQHHQALRCRLSRAVALLPQACTTLQNGLFAPNAGVQPPLCAPLAPPAFIPGSPALALNKLCAR